jgi:hypothetical protein
MALKYSPAIARTLLAVAAAFLISPASAQAVSGRPDTLRIATGSAGGTFLPVGHDLVAWWAQCLPDLVVLCDTTAGSAENLDRLESGEADLAIVGSSPFREILDRWRIRGRETEPLCALGTLYIDAEQYVVRSSLVRVGNLIDLNGLLMYPGPHQSGAEIDTRRILDLLGIEPRYVYAEERDKGYTAAARALVRGDFDAVTFSGGVPIEAVEALFAEHPGEFRILPFSRHMLNKLQTRDGDFDGVVIRRASYPGMGEDVQTVGGPNLLVAGPRVPAHLLAALDGAVRAGVRNPGQGLRRAGSHPVLQALDLELWQLRSVGGGCPGMGLADRDGDHGENAETDVAPR